jgi:hypothetical protein
MIGRHFGKQSSHQRPQSVRNSLNQPRALRQSHNAEPKRHHSPQTERDRHRRLRAIERAAGYIFQAIVPATDRDRQQHQREPNIIQHGNVLATLSDRCQSICYLDQVENVRFCVYFLFALTICIGLTDVDAQTENDWYHPQIYSPPSEKTPLILPATAGRPVLELSPEGREMAIRKLAYAAIIRLTPNEWRELKIGASANESLDRLINQTRAEVDEMHVPGLGPIRFDSNPVAIEIAAAWDKLKHRLHPYLVRAVTVDRGSGGKFYAHVWANTLTVTHLSKDSHVAKDDPLSQFASIIFNPQDVQLVKSPIVVYLDPKPTSFYTNIQIVRAGR